MSVGKGVDRAIDTAIIELGGLLRLAAKLGDRVLNRAIPLDEAAAQRTLAAHRLVEAEAEVDSLEPQFNLDTETGRINYATYQNLKAAQPENPLYAALVDEYNATQTSAPAHSPEQVAAGRPESDSRPPSASDSGHPTSEFEALCELLAKHMPLANFGPGIYDACSCGDALVRDGYDWREHVAELAIDALNPKQ